MARVTPHPKLGLALLILFVAMVSASSVPEQVHISYGPRINTMIVTFSTRTLPLSATVLYGVGGDLSLAAQADTKFFDGGASAQQYIHVCMLDGLASNVTYNYRAVADQALGTIYTFTTLPAGTDFPVRFAVYGDLGDENSQSFPSLAAAAAANQFDAVLHLGDYAYDLDTNGGAVGDAFLNLMQPIAANKPYMTAVGNHEAADNFTQFINRFSMPNNENGNLWFSFDVGCVHVVVYSSEVYFNSAQSINAPLQDAWLEQDLRQANVNRGLRPWIVTMAHRPMYCSNPGEDCNTANGFMRLHLEDLFFKNGVDFVLEAHEHSYERLYPVYNFSLTNAPSQPYAEPRAPVHLIAGSAGNPEGQSQFAANPGPWSAFRSSDYGWGQLTFFNATHAFWQQFKVADSTVLDSMWVVQHSHGPFSASGPSSFSSSLVLSL